MAANIGFLFTNVSSPLHFNFSGDTIPDVLKCGPQFLLNNPRAPEAVPQTQNDPNMKTRRVGFRKLVKVEEEDALEILVDLFDWLDGLELQPTTGIIPPYAKPHSAVANTHACTDQAVAKEAKYPAVSDSTCLHLLESYPHCQSIKRRI